MLLVRVYERDTGRSCLALATSVDGEQFAYPLDAPVVGREAPYEAWVRRGEEEHRPVVAMPSLHPARGVRTKVVAQSRRRYGRERGEIERSFGR